YAVRTGCAPASEGDGAAGALAAVPWVASSNMKTPVGSGLFASSAAVFVVAVAPAFAASEPSRCTGDTHPRTVTVAFVDAGGFCAYTLAAAHSPRPTAIAANLNMTASSRLIAARPSPDHEDSKARRPLC